MIKKCTPTILRRLFFVTLMIFSFSITAQNFTVKDGLIVVNDQITYTKKESKKLFQEIFSTTQKTTFASIATEKDQLGFEHETFQQQFNAVPVAFGVIKTHSKGRRIASVTSGFSYIPENFNTTAQLSASQALVMAQQHIGASSYLWEDEAASAELGYEMPAGELMILPPTYRKGDITLVYKFEIYSITPFGGGDYYIDATTGEILLFDNKVKHYDNFGHSGIAFVGADTEELYCAKLDKITESAVLATGNGVTRYSGNRSFETRSETNGTFTLNDDGRSVFTRNANNLAPVGSSLPYVTNYTEFVDNNNSWTAAEYDNAAKDNAALDAHWGMIQCYDYFNNVHGRDSYDNAGSQLRSYVHVDNNYDNAFWFLNTMSYGDGGSSFTPLTSLDVAAHELGHGITEYTANLVYQGESGGLNEGFSDIWGAAVEFAVKGNGNDANPNAETWDIGEEIGITGPLRSMSNPNSEGQPDTYEGTNWADTCIGCFDNGGVHINSGVLNYWFYLISAGGSGTNDTGAAFDVTGFGISKAALISYRTIATYLISSSNFAAARTASMQATADLYGYCSQEFVSVVNAWHAVGVGAAYEASLTLSETQACGASTLVITGGGYPGGVYSGTGVTDDGNGTSFTFDPDGLSTGDYTVTYTLSCGDTVEVATDTISVTDGVIDVVCQPYTVTLDGTGNASIVNQNVVANMDADTTSYTVDQTGTFSPETITGTTVSLGDDVGSSAINLGFPFSFYGTEYTQIYIASNGFVSFDNSGTSGNASWTPVALPAAGAPNNMIAFAWNDLSPNISGTIRYEVIGTAPNRKMILDFIDVPTYTNAPPSAFEVTTQLQLHEGSNRIEIHSTQIDDDGAAMTQGLENASGTAAISVPGRNAVAWSATNDYVAFVPNVSFPDNCGNAVSLSLSQNTFTCRDIGVNEVIITADDGAGGLATCTAMVTVIGETTTFNGLWNNGLPDAGKKAIFEANYSTELGNINACSCEVAATSIVTVRAGEYMNIDGNITVEGTLVVQHQGSVVQIDDTASVTNNGAINVALESPNLDVLDFMIMGSPMTAETREGVWASAWNVQNHTPSNFNPLGTVTDAYNFADAELDDWNLYTTGVLRAGEGFLVRPQTSHTGAGGVFSYSYTAGTLNNGVITRPLNFNTEQLNSPNMLSNPYASAINADLFLASNAEIDALYFWEHNTAPGNFPGANEAINYTMGDISFYNAVGPMAAATGGPVPTGVISTGQGFGTFANATGTATFNNSMRSTGPNNTFRTSTIEKNRLWLTVSSDSYNLAGTTLVGFLDGATNAIESKYDNIRFATPVSVFSHIGASDIGYSVQGREAFTKEDTISLGFSSVIDEVTSYTISLSDFDGIAWETNTPYLIDTVTGLVTDLKMGTYTFTSGKGNYNNRFTIVFEAEEVLNANDVILESISLFPNPASESFTVVSPNAVIEGISVSDVLGRSVLVLEESNVNSKEIDITSLQSATYLVQIKTSNGIVVKQLIKE